MDKEEEAFDEYRSAMPWPALPLHAPVVTALADRFRVHAIPRLVLLSADGDLISDDGVRVLRKHAKAFPWSGAKPPETPHLHGLYERLLRPDAVDPGSRQELPRYKEIDMIAQPARVTTHTDAVAAVRHCDWLCTALAVQAHSVHNTNFLKVALIEHTFTQLLPVPAPEGSADAATCVWRTPQLYDEQLSLLILLQRTIEHFASSALSLNHTRSLDAVRMVVPTCVATIADCVLRQLATNIPSELSHHLRCVVSGEEQHKGFGLDAGALAVQSAVVVCHSAELNIARSRALDYFAAQKLTKIFQWDKHRDLTPGLAKLLRHVCADRAFPSDSSSLIKYVTDVDALLMKNYPEIRCYRDSMASDARTSDADARCNATCGDFGGGDLSCLLSTLPAAVAFYFKFFLNPDVRCFPPPEQVTSQRAMQLKFSFDDGLFHVNNGGGATLRAHAPIRRGEPKPPIYRFSSLAVASKYTEPSTADTEDDILCATPTTGRPLMAPAPP